LIFYIVLIKVTDEDGKFSFFSKKSKWLSLKNSFRIWKEFLLDFL
jgi:hypothetical protein